MDLSTAHYAACTADGQSEGPWNSMPKPVLSVNSICVYLLAYSHSLLSFFWLNTAPWLLAVVKQAVFPETPADYSKATQLSVKVCTTAKFLFSKAKWFRTFSCLWCKQKEETVIMGLSKQRFGQIACDFLPRCVNSTKNIHRMCSCQVVLHVNPWRS